MAPRNARNNFYILGSGSGNGNAGTQGMSEWIGLSLSRKCVDLDGVWTKCLISVGITLLLVPSIFAIDGEIYIFWVILLTTCLSVQVPNLSKKGSFVCLISETVRLNLNLEIRIISVELYCLEVLIVKRNAEYILALL